MARFEFLTGFCLRCAALLALAGAPTLAFAF